MSSPSYRFTSLDPDFRRNPKTAVYCALCQKDIKGEPRFYAHMVNGCFAAVHPDDREIANHEIPEHENFGILPVGPDCAKIIGKEFVYSAALVAELKATGKIRD
jgi:hypothetical protein